MSRRNTILLLVAALLLVPAGTVSAHRISLSKAKKVTIKRGKQAAKRLAAEEGVTTGRVTARCRRVRPRSHRHSHRVRCRYFIGVKALLDDGSGSATSAKLICEGELSIRLRSRPSRRLRVRGVRHSKYCSARGGPTGDPPDDPAIDPDAPIPDNPG